MTKITAQDGASVRAISGDFSESDTYLHISSPDPNQNLDLLISHESRVLARVVPNFEKILGTGKKIDVNGIAIIENQR